MTREELIELGKEIVAENSDEERLRGLREKFSNNVPHPNGATLFNYPENFNARKMKLSQYNPTVEEVVDLALSYKPIILP